MAWETGVEMIEIIAESQKTHGCYTGKLFSFFHARELVGEDHGELEILTDSSLNGASTRELVLEMILSPSFYQRGEQ